MKILGSDVRAIELYNNCFRRQDCKFLTEPRIIDR